MAIFNSKEESQKKENSIVPAKVVAKQKETKKEKREAKRDAGAHLTKVPGRIIFSPRITEKALRMTTGHVYVFEVAMDVTKQDVARAIQALYGTTPRKVNVVRKNPRTYVARSRNRRGMKAGLKKAYVFLKKGEKIDLA